MTGRWLLYLCVLCITQLFISNTSGQVVAEDDDFDHDICYIVKLCNSSAYENFVESNQDIIIQELPYLKMVLTLLVNETMVDQFIGMDGVEVMMKDEIGFIELGPNATNSSIPVLPDERELSSESLSHELPDERKLSSESLSHKRNLEETVGWNIDYINALNVSDEFVSNRKVCLFSSGIDIDHPDLPSGNITGFNNTHPSAPDWQVDSAPGSQGTFNAGILAALGNNDEGIVGIVRNGELNIHISKVFDSSGAIYVSGMLSALDNCAAVGSNIVAIPMVFPATSVVELAINNLYNDDNILFVGESYNDRFPGRLDSMISTTAVDSDKTFWWGGYSVDISAPGSNDIIGTVNGGSYETRNGIFYASTHVAGVAALVWSHYPDKTNLQIRRALEESAEDLFVWYYGSGLVRADLAKAFFETSVPPSAPPSISSAPSTSSYPSDVPSVRPSYEPSSDPSTLTSDAPTQVPTLSPSTEPSISSIPSYEPSTMPSTVPTDDPSSTPSSHPSNIPSKVPSFEPSFEPSSLPSYNPSQVPTKEASLTPSTFPSYAPTLIPSSFPTKVPSLNPSSLPSNHPSNSPTLLPSAIPSTIPSLLPSSVPSIFPSTTPSISPTLVPSTNPTSGPSLSPTKVLSDSPSSFPTLLPSLVPSFQPSDSSAPTQNPSMSPSLSAAPTQDALSPSVSPAPSDRPSFAPSLIQDCGLLGLSDQTGYCYRDTQSASDAGTSVCDWNITLTDNLSIVHNVSQGVFLLSTKYHLEDHHYGVELFEKDCSTPATPTNFPLLFFDTINQPNSTTRINDVELQFLYNQTLIQESSLWTATKMGGYSEFCIAVNNYLDDNSSTGYSPFFTHVNFLQVRYRINVDSVTDFDTSVDIERLNATDGGVEYIDYEEDIEAFTCDDDFQSIDATYSQGESANICVKTVDDSKFEVHDVKELHVAQWNVAASPPYIFDSYEYIADFQTSPLSYTLCINKNTKFAICRVKIKLIAAWFEEAQIALSESTLKVEGTVKLDYLGRRLSVNVPINLRIGEEPNRRSIDSRSLVNGQGVNGLPGFQTDMKISTFNSQDSEYDDSGGSHTSSLVSILMALAVGTLVGRLFSMNQ